LSRLAAEAEASEAHGDRTGALSAWRRALAFLPPDTRQASVIQARMRELSQAIDGRGPEGRPAKSRAGAAQAGRRAGIVGVVGAALLKAKTLAFALLANGKLLVLGLLKAPTVLSALLYMRFFRGGAGGLGFAFGVVACIYVHEMGHVAALRRYGIQASAPMFVPGFGALVRLRQYPTDAHEDARTGLAGPIWGLFAACVAAVVGWLVPSALVISVASVAARINLFNLIAVWQLDGSRGLRALSRDERLAVAAVALLAGLVAHQWMPMIVAAAAGARAFASDAHPTGDRGVLGWFVGLVISLTALSALPM
jgi:Zn-dependent protease